MLEYYRHYFTDKRFLLTACVAVLGLALSLVVNYYAGTYAVRSASNSVTDIILNNTPVFNVDGIFINGAIVFWIFVCILLARDLQKMPFTFKSIALFVILRSVFVSLTHIAPFPVQSPVVIGYLLRDITFGADLFFSGHTGLPYLLALIFWEHRLIRWLFLCCSVLFGVVVLLGHLHYSIDVLSAFFITYSIFHIAERLFVSDRRLFYHGLLRQ